MTIAIKDIQWGDRARKDYGDIVGLVASIKEHGLIEPIILDDSLTLIAGGRRLTAMIASGAEKLEHGQYMLKGEISPLRLRKLELEENLRRKDLTWQEQAFLVSEIHRLEGEEKGEDEVQTVQETAILVEKSDQFVRDNLKLAAGIEQYPELVKEKDFKTARTKLRRFVEQERRALVASESPDIEYLFNNDAREVLRGIKDDSIDLVLLDPPYGTNIHNKEGRGSERTGSWTWGGQTYDDSVEYSMSLLDELLKEVARILKPGAHCYIFFGLSVEFDTGLVSKIIDTHLGRQKLPLFWVKNTHTNKDPYKRFGINYEGIFFCWKGTEPRDMLSASHAVLSYPVDTKEKQHPSEKPSELYRRLISISSQEGEIVLDPTAGSGTSIATAKSMGRKVIGIELDPTWFDVMKTNIMEEDKKCQTV